MNIILQYYQNYHELSSLLNEKAQQNRTIFGSFYQNYRLSDCLEFIENRTGVDSERALQILQIIGGKL